MTKRKMTALIVLVLIITMVATLLLSTRSYRAGEANHVRRKDWSDDVKIAINDFLDLYGNTSKYYDKKFYAVTDFDNTASIYDTCEQLMIYQAEHMAYGFTPEELPDILATDLSDMDKNLSDLGYGKGSYNDWIRDITDAYTYLYKKYGPFKPSGLSSSDARKLQKDPMWTEFTAKMMNLYCLIGDNESIDVSYPWLCYWFSGMTDDEVYALAKESHHKYKNVMTKEETLKTSKSIKSRVGVTEYTYIDGISVTRNTRELWKQLKNNGIDVWVCTASESNVIRAAIDEFGLHDYCSGVIGMTPKHDGDRITNGYDYETGYAWIPEKNGKWSRGDVASEAQTQGIGKVTAIQNICGAKYGCGPVLGLMDSTGDFNFCTEFQSLALVVCFNRADRPVTDGGSLVAEVAMYQQNILGYDLLEANMEGDTYYVLQGRNENKLRSLRNSNETVRYGTALLKLYDSSQNNAVYDYIAAKKLTTEEAFRIFSDKTSVNSKNNRVGFNYGFLEDYLGYHSRHYGDIVKKFLNLDDSELTALNKKDSLPESYNEECREQGTLEDISYKTEIKGKTVTKHAMVYLPYGYNEYEKYDVVYLMHGRGGKYKTWLGSEDEPRPFKNILDNMIEKGDIRPIIVVTPELSYKYGDKPTKQRDEASDYAVMDGTGDEITQQLIPIIDERYSTYGDRNHRGMSGFSMGGSLTWHMLMDHTECFYYYIPMSMALYYDKNGYSESKSKEAVNKINNKLKSAGYGPGDYKIYVATGDEDHKSVAAFMMVKDLVENSEEFVYADSDYKDGNIFLNVWSGRWHKYTQSFPYMYNGLKKFFPPIEKDS